MKLRFIIMKDVKKIVYDKKLLAGMIVMPIILMTILGFSLRNMFGVSEGSVGGINVAVVKNYHMEEEIIRFRKTIEKGFLSSGMDEETKNSIISGLTDNNPEKIFFEFLDIDKIQEVIDYTIQDEEKAKEMLTSKDVDAVIILPEGYIYNTYMNYMMPVRNIVELEIFKNTDNNMRGSIVEGLVDGFVQTMNDYCLNKEVFINQVTEYDNIESAFMGVSYLMTEVTNKLDMNNISINNIDIEKKKNLTSFQYYAAAIMAMFLLYSASTGGKFLLEEKNEITFQRNRVSGVSLSKIITSNFFMMCIIAWMQSIVMILYSRLILNIDWGNITLVLFTMIVTSFAIGGIGVLVSIITLTAGNYKFANLFEFGIIQFMALIGGSFVPVEVLPKVMHKLSMFSINGVALKMYTSIMRGVVLADILNYAFILVGMGVVFITVATMIAKTKKGAI